MFGGVTQLLACIYFGAKSKKAKWKKEREREDYKMFGGVNYFQSVSLMELLLFGDKFGESLNLVTSLVPNGRKYKVRG